MTIADTFDLEAFTFDLHGAFPFDNYEEAGGNGQYHSMLLGEDKPFLYIGQALTRAEFAAYVRDYDFGKLPPSYIVFHHTPIPSASWARWPGAGAVWDAGEEGLNEAQIKAKRLKQLAAIRDFYRGERGWDRGPHLFCDDRYIYLFTPMYDVGIHAAEGNAVYKNGKLVKYGIGIECIGYFENTPWPDAVARNAGFAVATLQRRLKTFELVAGTKWSNLTSHRQYNKPACPGAAITEAFYTQACKTAAEQLDEVGRVKAFSVHPRLLGAWQMSGGIWQKDRLTPGLPTAAAFIGTDGCLYQRFERSVARLKADGGVEWLLLGEIAALSAPALDIPL